MRLEKQYAEPREKSRLDLPVGLEYVTHLPTDALESMLRELPVQKARLTDPLVIQAPIAAGLRFELEAVEAELHHRRGKYGRK
jgi:hypothetical protein